MESMTEVIDRAIKGFNDIQDAMHNVGSKYPASGSGEADTFVPGSNDTKLKVSQLLTANCLEAASVGTEEGVGKTIVKVNHGGFVGKGDILAEVSTTSASIAPSFVNITAATSESLTYPTGMTITCGSDTYYIQSVTLTSGKKLRLFMGSKEWKIQYNENGDMLFI